MIRLWLVSFQEWKQWDAIMNDWAVAINWWCWGEISLRKEHLSLKLEENF